jgi:hypothetical protein
VSDYGATYSDLQPRVLFFTIGASTSPSTTQVNAWIDEAEAKINNTLKAGGMTTPISNAEGVEQLKALSVDYAEARLRMTLSPPGTEGHEQGRALLADFNAILTDMRSQPADWSAMLSGGTAAEGSRRIRSHILDDVDGRASDDDDFEATFTKADAGNQF